MAIRRKPKQETAAKPLAAGEEPEQGSARPFWSGTITFGLVSIPVELFSAYRSVRTSLRMLAPEDRTPLVRRYFCPTEQRWLEADEIVRGYETDDGEFVVVTDEELEALEPRKSRDIELKRFVDAASIPPLYFEQSYWLAPSGQSVRAYHLLATTMARGDKAGIATFVMRGKEHLVAILSDQGLLRAETLRFADELRSPEQVGLPAPEPVEARVAEKLRRAIQKRSADKVDWRELKDSYAERLLKLVHDKQKSKENIVKLKQPEQESGGEVIDLMAVLKRSLAAAGNTAGAEASSPRDKADANQHVATRRSGSGDREDSTSRAHSSRVKGTSKAPSKSKPAAHKSSKPTPSATHKKSAKKVGASKSSKGKLLAS